MSSGLHGTRRGAVSPDRPAGGRPRTVVAAVLAFVLSVLGLGFVPSVALAEDDAAAPASVLAAEALSSTGQTIPAGALIIDMGGTAGNGAASGLTIGNQLKPYGFVQDLLLNYRIPLLWVIADGKTTDSAVDFTATTERLKPAVGATATRNYSTGAFVIRPEYVPFIQNAITSWGNQGVIIDRATASFDAPVYQKVQGWPKTALDSKNGSIAGGYYLDAGIGVNPEKPKPGQLDPRKPYFKDPSALTTCDDLYVMPHADPEVATHAQLLPFNEAGGYIWAGCHSVSVLENMSGTAGGTTYPAGSFNFLSEQGLVDYGKHGNGSPPYTTSPDRSDPIQQYWGKIDLATTNGSESIYLPTKGSAWRSTSKVLTWDPTQADIPSRSDGPAAAMVYGRGFGDPSNGMVMYEAGHELKGGSTDELAAKRAFLNFNLLAATDENRSLHTTASADRTTVAGGESIQLNAASSGGAPAYTYQWSSTCGGTFNDATIANPVFTAPTDKSVSSCLITVQTGDSCNRFAVDGVVLAVEHVRISKSVNPTSGTPVAAGQTLTYTLTLENTGSGAASQFSYEDDLTDVIDDATLNAASIQTQASQGNLTATVNPAGNKIVITGNLPSNATSTVTFTVTVKPDGQRGNNSLGNHFIKSGTTPPTSCVAGSTTCTVNPIADPKISIVKTADKAQITAADETITYSFLVKNEGNVPLSSVAVNDQLAGLSARTFDWANSSDAATGAGTLSPGETVTATATYVVKQSDVDAGAVNNTATSQGVPPGTTTPTVSAPAPVTIPAVAAPKLGLTKVADKQQVTAAGEVITYTFVVTNQGNVSVTGVVVNDPMPGLSGRTFVSSTGGSAEGTLVPGESATYTATYTATQADIDGGAIQNVAQAQGTPPGSNVPPVFSPEVPQTVNTPDTPVITVVKTADPNTVTAAGQSVAYTFVVRNAGNVTLSSVALSDPLVGLSVPVFDWASSSDVATAEGVLSPGETVTATATYTATQADVDAGAILNTATAQGTPPGTETPVTGSDNETVTAPSSPKLGLTKVADKQQVTAAGDVITYTFIVSNQGNVTMTGVVVNDPMPGLSARTFVSSTGGSASGTLKAGESATYTATYTVTQADIDGGAILNTAQAEGTPPGTGVPPVKSPEVPETVETPDSPAITVDKSADPLVVTASGQSVEYTFVVRNAGNVTLTSVGLSDQLAGLSTPVFDWAASSDAATGDGVLSPGETVTATAAYTATQKDVDAGAILNTATAQGTPPGTTTPVTATDNETVTAPSSPKLGLTKVADKEQVTAAGDVITYTFVVSNNGNVTVTGVVVNDPMPGLSARTFVSSTAGSAEGTLLPGESATYTATYTATQADIDGGAILNTAQAEGTPPGTDVPPVKSPEVPETVETPDAPKLGLTKVADKEQVTAAGDVITYTFVVSNQGNVTMTGVVVNDPMPGLSAPTFVSSTQGSAEGTLVPGESATYTATYTVTQADIDGGAILNTAQAQGTPPGSNVPPVFSPEVPETVETPDAPKISVVKTADPKTVAAAGETVSYSFLVKNEGNVTLTSVGLSDPLVGLSTPVFGWAASSDAATGDGVLSPGETVTATATYVATQADVDAGAILNTATAQGTPPGTTAPVTGSDNETVTVPSSPKLGLTKVADKEQVSAAGDVITYTFVVSNQGNVTMTGVVVNDPMPGLSARTFVSSTQGSAEGTLAPGESATYTAAYTVTQSDIDGGAILNTAQAQGTPPGSNVPPVFSPEVPETVETPDAPKLGLTKAADKEQVTTAGEMITYTFVVSNEGNVTVTGVVVNDPMPGLSNRTFVSSTAGSAEGTLVPGETATYTATYTVTQADIDGGAILNVARAQGTPPGTDVPVDSPEAPETVETPDAPKISLVKSADPLVVTAAGQPVAYTFLVKNEGNVTLTAVSVSDPLVGLSTPVFDWAGSSDAATGDGVLSPGETVTATASYTATQTDIDAGAIVNIATAQGTPPGTDEPVTGTHNATVTAPSSPKLGLTKVADKQEVTAAGDVITYTFVVSNQGNVTMTGVVVNDPMEGLSARTFVSSTQGSAEGTLVPGESATYTATYTVMQADIDGGAILNTAQAEGTPPGTDVPPVFSPEVPETVETPDAPKLSLTKVADKEQVTVAGELITYTFVVKNDGNVTMTGVAVNDPMAGLSARTFVSSSAGSAEGTLVPGESATYTATYTVTQADIDGGAIQNIAQAQGTPPGTDVPPVFSPEVPETVETPDAPKITVVKAADPQTVTAARQPVAYTFVVTNEGNVTLSGVGLSDPLVGLSTPVFDWASSSDVATAEGVLSPGETVTATATYTATQADVDAGAILNTATAQGTPPGTETPVTGSDSETVTAPADPKLSLTKAADNEQVSTAGDVVTYTFVVTNNGNVTMTGVVVNDAMEGLSARTFVSSTQGSAEGTLVPGESATYTATYTVTQSDIDGGAILNTAQAQGTPPGTDVPPVFSPEVPETVETPDSPAITLDKSADPLVVTAAGQPVEYTFVVRNAGNVTLTSVGLSDQLAGLSTQVFDWATSSDAATGEGVLSPGETVTATATYTATQADVDAGAILNTATAQGTPPGTETPVTANDSETVTAPADPVLALTKVADKQEVTTASDVITYTFVVSNQGNVTMTGVVVNDAMEGLSARTFVSSTQGSAEGTLVPGESATYTATYTVTQSDIDGGAILNTAQAEGTPPGTDVPPVKSPEVPETVETPDAPVISVVKTADPKMVAAAGETVSYTFVVKNEGNVNLTGVGLSDPLVGLSAPVFDWAASSDAATGEGVLSPGETVTATATYVATQADVNAGAILNTATAQGTPPGSETPVTGSDNETVTAPADPVLALTKVADKQEVTAAGDVITYTFVVSNNGNVTVTGVVVNDAMEGLSARTFVSSTAGSVEGTLVPGESATYTATYTATQADIDGGAILNTAQAEGTPPGTDVPPVKSPEVPETVETPDSPAITVDKSADPLVVTAAGQSVSYTFVVRNAGNVTLSGVGLSDPLVGLSAPVFDWAGSSDAGTGEGVLSPGETVTATATYVATQADVDAGAILNTATAQGTPPGTETPVTGTDSETVMAPADPKLALTKVADKQEVTSAGDVITYTFVVSNQGNVTMTGVVVNDAMEGLSARTFVSSTQGSAEGTLVPGESATYTATYTVTQADIDGGAILNTASAQGTPPGTEVPVETPEVPETVQTPDNPVITVVKTADPTTVTAAGEAITYTFAVANAGNVTLTEVGVTDALSGLSTPVFDWAASSDPATGDGILSPGETVTATASYTATQADVDSGSILNTATAKGTPPGTDTPVTATDSETVTAPAAPALTLTKVADKERVAVAGDVITYTFVVTNRGNVTMTGVVVNDPMPGLSAPTFVSSTDGSPAGTLNPGESARYTATYTVTAADLAADRVDNVASASGNTPDGDEVTSPDVTESVSVVRPLAVTGTQPIPVLPAALLVAVGLILLTVRKREERKRNV